MCRRATSSEATVCSHHRTTLVATVLRVAVSAALAFVGRLGGLDPATTTTIPSARQTLSRQPRPLGLTFSWECNQVLNDEMVLEKRDRLWVEGGLTGSWYRGSGIGSIGGGTRPRYHHHDTTSSPDPSKKSS